jgi:beta-fructofuranosidase
LPVVRPSAHFTALRGWLNDPYGVHWDGAQYHLYYQSVAGSRVWAPECRWGHATSPDLVCWTERAPVLAPTDGELGCWSGCVVEDPAGGRRAFYTRVGHGDRELGSIAVATPDACGRFVSAPAPVIAGPPDVAVTAFRDPYVWFEAGAWTMLVGAGRRDGTGAVLQYRSADLERWRYVGPLCGGRLVGDPPAGREVWECPQMMEVDGRWLLVVSVQLDGRAALVAAAIGGYDGIRFEPTRWQRLAHGSAPYAASLFRDRDGRPCMICWLREDSGAGVGPAPWAGALSLVAAVGVDPAGIVSVTPHPAVVGRHGPVQVFLDADILEVFGAGRYGAWRART